MQSFRRTWVSSAGRGVSVAALVVLAGCAAFDTAGGHFVSGAATEATSDQTRQHLLALEKALVAGLVDPATGEETTRKLRALEAELLSDVRSQLKGARSDLLDDKLYADLSRVREELVGAPLREDLRELLGSQTQSRLHEMVQDVLGDATQARVAALRDELIGQTTETRVAALREELAGAPLRAEIDKLIDQASSKLKAVTPSLLVPFDEELNTAKSRVLWLAVGLTATIGAAVLGLGFGMYVVKKHRDIIRILTKSIESFDSSSLKKAIEEKADAADLDDYLQRLLIKNGIHVGKRTKAQSSERPAREATPL